MSAPLAQIQLLLTLSVVEVLLFVIVLAYFLARVGRLLNAICSTLGKIAFGVRAVETQCLVIGPAADRINQNLTQTAKNLELAAIEAERLARR